MRLPEHDVTTRAADWQPFSDDVDPRERAMRHLEHSRRSFNEAVEILNTSRPGLEREVWETLSDEQKLDDTALALTTHMMSAMYGVLSSIGNSLVVLAAQADEPSIVVNVEGENPAMAAQRAGYVAQALAGEPAWADSEGGSDAGA